MKTSLSIITLLICFFVSIQTLACPNLSGQYTCLTDDGQAKPLSISQQQINFSFVMGTSEWKSVADNVNRKITDYPGYEDVYEQAWCNANQLTIKNTGRVLKKGGGYYGTETAYYYISKNSYGVTFKEFATLVMDGTGKKHYYNMTYTCDRS